MRLPHGAPATHSTGIGLQTVIKRIMSRQKRTYEQATRSRCLWHQRRDRPQHRLQEHLNARLRRRASLGHAGMTGAPRPVTRYITRAEYFWLAEQVTSADAGTLAKDARSDLADSALHAPQAGFGDTEFHPDVIDKAAVPVCRLAWNHPLPDGNKRPERRERRRRRKATSRY